MLPLLSIAHLGLQLGDHHVLKHITMHVDEGEVVGLIGPNGSGKTTLFNVLSGFLKPSMGSLTYRNEDITHLSAAARAHKGIGRVFQNFGIFRDMTLEENVFVALEALQKHERRKLGNLATIVSETLEMVGLSSHAKAKAGSLSGGQMRLLEIARTLASGKDLFLLDEPTAGVSPKLTKHVAALIRQLKEKGKTVLIIEHDLPFISSICDRIVVLDVGEIVLTGTPQEVKSDKKLQAIYFGEHPTE